MRMNKTAKSKKGRSHLFFFCSTSFCMCVCVLVCSGPCAPGAAVGGGVCADWCPGQSAEAAAAEHRPAAAHFPAGQTDPGAGAQSCWPVNIQWVAVLLSAFSFLSQCFKSSLSMFSPLLISIKKKILSWAHLSSFHLSSLCLPVVMAPFLIQFWHAINYPWQPSLRTQFCSPLPAFSQWRYAAVYSWIIKSCQHRRHLPP